MLFDHGAHAFHGGFSLFFRHGLHDPRCRSDLAEEGQGAGDCIFAARSHIVEGHVLRLGFRPSGRTEKVAHVIRVGESKAARLTTRRREFPVRRRGRELGCPWVRLPALEA